MKNKKNILVIVLVAILVSLFAGIYFYSTREKSVLFCYKNTNSNEYFNYYMSYEVFKGRNYIKLKQINKVSIEEIAYNQLLKSGFNDQMLTEYFYETLKVELNSTFKDYGDNIKSEIVSSSKSVEVLTLYKINSKTQNEFKQLFRINFYKASLDDMQEFYESGDMVCERK